MTDRTDSKLTLEPRANMIVGELVDVVRRGKLVLPDSQLRGISVVVRVEAVGPLVQRCKVGDLIVPHVNNRFMLRDGYSKCLVADDEVWAIVHGLDVEVTTEADDATPTRIVPEYFGGPAAGGGAG